MMLPILRMTIIGIIFLTLSSVGPLLSWVYGADGADLVVATVKRLSAEDIDNNRIDLQRGQFVKTEAFVANLGPARSGPFSVGIYLSDDPDGQNRVHEFDVITNLDLKGSEYKLIKGEYIIPVYNILPARFYWVVVEADYEKNVAEEDEKNKKIIQKINVLCDDLNLNYSNTYLCPSKKEKFHFND
ncbi:MAG TPA: hypothetical protein VGB26_10500 [Nitrospiria bacterium]